MSSFHLSAGSQQPPKVEGKLRLYSMQYCPFAQRTRFVLKIKNVPHDIVNIDLGKKPEWYAKIHPDGKVPALDTGSQIIVESTVICDYLDETYPNNPLYPKDPELKNRDKELIVKFNPVLGIFYKCFLKQEKKSAQEWAKEFSPHLEMLQTEIDARGTTFFGGTQPGMVDYMIWPWAERAPVIAMSVGQKLPFPEGQFARMRQWVKAMKEDPVCKEINTKPEIYFQLGQNALNNVPTDYDAF